MEPIGDWIEVAPWRDRAVSLLCINLIGDARQDHTLDGKRELLAIDRPYMLLALWTGKYRTEARRITAAEQAKVVERLG